MLAFDYRTAKLTWIMSLVVLSLYAAYSVRRTLFVFVLAVFLSYMLCPAVRRLERLTRDRMSRTTSATVVFALLLLLLAGLAALIGPPVAEQGTRLAERLPQLTRDPKVFERLPLPEWKTPIASVRIAQELRSRSAPEATGGSIP